ncbi:MAG: hypothetical protein KKF30_18190 [Proteobacteria bacterium]|nr:hypothetical protein [Pseudomonadota bacterium]MBU4469823.1 hypothetical protein [Pseudomonadota bacterium]MCG2753058.1 hypothetical protein [Desulfobacteraceae bacterium]
MKRIDDIGIIHVSSFLLLMLLMVCVLSCSVKKEETENHDTRASGPFYRFIPGSDGMLERAEKIELPSEMNTESVLKVLGEDLAQTYFAENPSGEKTGIGFDILTVSEIESAGRSYRVAVVNMVDQKKDALHYFFQGSYGGQLTFYMIAGTLIQPQTHPPLVDGIILQYNGEVFPALDHINFQGIVVPGTVSTMVKTAIYRNVENP